MLFGREAKCPMDLVTQLDKNVEPPNAKELEEKIALRIKNAVAFGIANKQLAQRIGKIQYDKHHIEFSFEEGDLVLLDSHPLSKKAQAFSAGLAPKREGPYIILKKTNRQNYLLGDPSKDNEIVTYAHISQLTKFTPRDDEFKSAIEAVKQTTADIEMREVPGKKRGRPKKLVKQD